MVYVIHKCMTFLDSSDPIAAYLVAMYLEKQKVCTYFLKGKCRFGNKCHFSHIIVRSFLLRHT